LVKVAEKVEMVAATVLVKVGGAMVAGTEFHSVVRALGDTTCSVVGREKGSCYRFG